MIREEVGGEDGVEGRITRGGKGKRRMDVDRRVKGEERGEEGTTVKEC